MVRYSDLQRGSFAEAVAADAAADFNALRQSQRKRATAAHEARITEVKRYLKSTGDLAAKGFLEMEAEDSCDLGDPRWKAWNAHGGSKRCRDWLRGKAA